MTESTHRCCAERRYGPAAAIAVSSAPCENAVVDQPVCLMAKDFVCCCRLLDSWVHQAKRQGVPSHKIVTWIRRKIGTHISVIRYRSDGTMGCAVPCVFCQKELMRYDMRVHCVDSSGNWLDARLTDGNVPKPVLTAGQRRMLNK